MAPGSRTRGRLHERQVRGGGGGGGLTPHRSKQIKMRMTCEGMSHPPPNMKMKGKAKKKKKKEAAWGGG